MNKREQIMQAAIRLAGALAAKEQADREAAEAQAEFNRLVPHDDDSSASGSPEAAGDLPATERAVLLVDAEPGRAFSAQEIAKAVGASSVESMRTGLGRMVKRGRMRMAGRGLYQSMKAPTLALLPRSANM